MKFLNVPSTLFRSFFQVSQSLDHFSRNRVPWKEISVVRNGAADLHAQNKLYSVGNHLYSTLAVLK
jgi:hypothetical protein